MIPTNSINQEISIEYDQLTVISSNKIQLNEVTPFISLESDKLIKNQNYSVEIIMPIVDRFDDLETITHKDMAQGFKQFKDIASIEKFKYLKIPKEKIYFCYSGIHSLSTELSPHTDCRAFSVVYTIKKQEKPSKSSFYKYYLLKFDYKIKDNHKAAKAIFIEMNIVQNGKYEPRLKRGTVTTPQEGDGLDNPK